MKQLKSKTMKRFLERGIRKAKKTKRPSEGTFVNLISETLPNGYHYQVEYVYDLRWCKRPVVSVYCFRPPRNQSARRADYYLEREV